MNHAEVKALITKGRYVDALSCLNNANQQTTEIRLLRAQVLHQLGRYQQAVRILEPLRNCGEKTKEVEAELILADIRWREGVMQDCKHHIDLARAKLGEGDRVLQGKLMRIEGMVAWRCNDTNLARERFQESLEVFNKAGRILDVGVMHNSLGIYHHSISDFKNAEKHFITALECFTRMGNSHFRSMALNNISMLHLVRGDYKKALSALEESHAIKLEAGNGELLAHSFHALGLVYALNGDSDSALEYYALAEEYYHSQNDMHGICRVLQDGIETMVLGNDFENASEKLSELEKIVQKAGVGETEFMYSLGLVCKVSPFQHEQDEAERIFREMIEKNADSWYALVAKQVLCEILLKRHGGHIEEIGKIIAEMVDFAKRQQSYAVLVSGYILLAKFHMIMGDLKRAKNVLTAAKITCEENGLHSFGRLMEDVEQDLKAWRAQGTLRSRIDRAKIIDALERRNYIAGRFPF